MNKTKVFSIDGRSYEALITTRRTSRLSMRFAKDGKLHVSVPFLTPMKAIDSFVISRLPLLLEKVEEKPRDIDEHGYYLFGKYRERGSLTDAQIKKYLRKTLMEYLEEKCLYYEGIMKIHPYYAISIRDMSTRYGVNSAKTHRVTFALCLAHYSREIIDSVIVHELAHHFERNHQKGFYDIVYRYCPDYDRLHAKLRKNIHE